MKPRLEERAGGVGVTAYVRGLIEADLASDTPPEHPMDSPDRSAKGDGGWSTKVVRGPHQTGPSTTGHEFEAISLSNYHCKHCGGRKRDHT